MKHLRLLIASLLVVAALAVAGAVMTQADTKQDTDPIPEPAFEDLSAIRVSQVLTPSAYLPVVNKWYFEAFDYADNFDNLNSGWPYGSSPFGYGYITDPGDGSTAYFLRVDQEYQMGWVTAPTLAPGDFQLDVWGRRIDMPKYWFDEYGIFISPTPIDPKNPSANGVYTLIIELKVGEDPSYVVHKWNTLSRSNRTQLARQVEKVYITQVARAWNQFRIVRSGDTLNFYVSHAYQSGWELAHTLTDSSLPHMFYVGLYAQHSKDDLGYYKIEFQYDNVELSAQPQ